MFDAGGNPSRLNELTSQFRVCPNFCRKTRWRTFPPQFLMSAKTLGRLQWFQRGILWLLQTYFSPQTLSVFPVNRWRSAQALIRPFDHSHSGKNQTRVSFFLFSFFSPPLLPNQRIELWRKLYIQRKISDNKRKSFGPREVVLICQWFQTNNCLCLLRVSLSHTVRVEFSESEDKKWLLDKKKTLKLFQRSL